MPLEVPSLYSTKAKAFIAGAIFLIGYWLLSYDGITFSDDVYYLLAGKNFWEGTMEVNSYHFSSRWGAYVPSGLIGFLLGFDPHLISLISLISYLGALGLLFKILPQRNNPWILTLWFCTQVYFLHFLTKVYPDSLLVFWTTLVPVSAYFRNQKPFLAALGLVGGLFFGFLTKETIVFLAPFPILLFVWDWKNRVISKAFYFTLISIGLLLGSLYLGYFWIKFGDPFYRVSSINAGHYISEYTYADKGLWAMFRRLTYLPILTFVERGYWLWLVMAIPGIQLKKTIVNSPALEMSLAFCCLILGFWLMTSTLELYNPIYLNPRHLIILVPVLAFLIASGWGKWNENQFLFRWILGLILLGIGISLVQMDWKMAGFQAVFLGIIFPPKFPKRIEGLAVLFILPAFAAVFYQQKVKAYPEFIKALDQEVKNATESTPILTNNFIHFSREVLFPDDSKSQELLYPIEELDSLKKSPPQELRILIYEYYQHAYPKEQEDLDLLEPWLANHYQLTREEHSDLVWIREFERTKK
ncbi:hypothetical protein [Algoriphagus boseongensis]|nr:hypothetical protein [Algoriphagus boseongensis]